MASLHQIGSKGIGINPHLRNNQTYPVFLVDHVSRHVSATLSRLKTSGYVPCKQLKCGYVPEAKSANRQKRGYVPDRIFANRCGYELVVSFSLAILRRYVY